MNGKDEYAPDRGVGGFPEFDPFSNTCANCCILRSSISRPLAGRFGGLLEVNSPGGLLEASWKYTRDLNELLCSFVISMDEPEVRRVGFASFVILPPSRAIAPLLLWRRGSSGSGGGLCAMLERPKFVPMARPYAPDTPISLFIYNSLPRERSKKRRPSRPDDGKGFEAQRSMSQSEGSFFLTSWPSGLERNREVSAKMSNKEDLLKLLELFKDRFAKIFNHVFVYICLRLG